ncbi:MAG TPA: PDZ domain-containing protein [Puia sp.]|nr:PDZ domain-containing protein [Puia sp.]
MKQYVLRLSGIAAIALLLSSSVFAQDDDAQEKVLKDKIRTDKLNEGDEIVIKRKGDKDIKVTVEIKDNKIFVDGKPVTEFNDDNVIVRKMQAPFYSNDNMTFIAPRSPFRSGGWSYSGDGDVLNMNNAKTAFLGVTWDDVDNGARITEITKESAADKGGLKIGDIITKIGDTKVGAGELSDEIHKYKPEEKVTITYLRDGKEQKTTVTLGRLKEMNFKSFNMAMPKMNDKLNYNFNGDNVYAYSFGKPRLGIKAQDLEEGKGAKVLDVDDESPAEKAGIKEGDVINELDGKPVENAEDLAKLAHANKEKYTYKVKLTRDGKQQEVEVKIPRKLKTADL